MRVTRDLERLVSDVEERDFDLDVVMGDATTPLPVPTPATSVTPAPTPTNATNTNSTLCGSVAPPVLTTSWVMVKGEDWEMIDCAA